MASDEMDASKFRPQGIHATVLLTNQMILQTTSFLNEFSQTVERKISNVSAKVTQLEILLAVLEAKINSVPAVDDEAPSRPVAAAAQKEEVPEVSPNAAAATAAPPPPPPVAAPPPPPPPPYGEQKVEVEEVPAEAGPPAHFVTYTKMLKMGLPEAAVRLKMAANGVTDEDAEAFLSKDYGAIKSKPPLAIEEG